MRQYEQDYDETLPYNYNRYGNVTDRWYRTLYPYYKSIGVVVCPDKTDGNFVPTLTPANATTMSAGPSTPGGYGLNYALSPSYYNPNMLDTYVSAPRALADITDVAGTFAICDAGQARAAISGNTDPVSWPKQEWSATDYMVMPPSSWTGGTKYYQIAFTAGDSDNYGRRPMARHNGGLSVIYTDGHAKWANISSFLGVSASRPDGWPYGDPNNSWDDK